MSGIVWISSYPKSGNTWFRAFVANMTNTGAKEFDINNLGSGWMIKELVSSHYGYDVADLTAEELDNLLPDLYEQIARVEKNTQYIKTHDAYLTLPDGRPLIPNFRSRVLHIVRNPLDVAVSFAHHRGSSIDSTIEVMNNNNIGLNLETDRYSPQLRQRFLSWSAHVASWLDVKALPVLVIRYEDMQLRPLEIFSLAARFVGLSDDQRAIENAIRLSDFKELRKHEQAAAFHEKPEALSNFFREGRIGGWRNALTSKQVSQIVNDHQIVMRHCGYLSVDNKLIY
ncbi:MAG: sulfotransferase domain-containing protein [Negativicutes bacterium]|jgi:hypothetical protein